MLIKLTPHDERYHCRKKSTVMQETGGIYYNSEDDTLHINCDGDYVMDGRIGVGKSSRVYRITKDNTKSVIKISTRPEGDWQEIEDEGKILKYLNRVIMVIGYPY